jgi:hypothetical protein
LKIDIPEISFEVFESTSKFSKKQRGLFTVLFSILGMVLFFALMRNIIRIFPHTFDVKIRGYIVIFGAFGFIFLLGLLLAKLVYGKLLPAGKIEFNSSAIEIRGKLNQTIRYNELIYLSCEVERPENQYQRRPGAKTYQLIFMLESGEKYPVIVNRLSMDQPNKTDLYHLLSLIRKQNHHLYKALRGMN